MEERKEGQKEENYSNVPDQVSSFQSFLIPKSYFTKNEKKKNEKKKED